MMGFEFSARGVGLGVLIAIGAVSFPKQADACGGCVPVSTRPTIVSDHRMVLLLSAQSTTLWDQFQYAGDPSEFVWVLPLFDTSHVEFATSDDRFMALMDAQSAPRFTVLWPRVCTTSRGLPNEIAPNRQWPPTAFAELSPAFDATDPDAVQSRSAVVGPYEVFLIPAGARDRSFTAWADSVSIRLNDETRTLIASYDELHAGYVVARMRPDAGTRRMQPIRITLTGYQPALPLRMIALGASDSLSLTLMVIANDSMRIGSKPEVLLDPTQIPFDRSRPNYAAYLDSALARSPGAWLTETAFETNAAETLTNYTPEPAVRDEVQRAFAGLTSPTVTRLRTVLRRTDLARDLELDWSGRRAPRTSQIPGVISREDCDSLVPAAAPNAAPGMPASAMNTWPSAVLRSRGCHCSTHTFSRYDHRAALLSVTIALGAAMVLSVRRRSRATIQ
ncbi:MAG: DUF2330 domain-containing protein [Polyangiales bacterium]